MNDTKREIKNRDIYFINNERNILKNVAYIFSTNSKCAEFLINQYNLKNVTTLTGGINFETSFSETECQILAAKKKNKDILFIGKGAYKRGVDILIEAFNLFNRANANAFTLHLVGIAAENTASVDDKIIRHGYLNKNNPSDLKTYYDLLKKARLFVMPMRHGPRPGVVKEAGLMYTPVITTNIWNMEELIKNNVNGILVERFDPRVFADRMDFLVKNETIWGNIARKAHQMAKNKYSWDNAISSFLSKCSRYLES